MKKVKIIRKIILLLLVSFSILTFSSLLIIKTTAKDNYIFSKKYYKIETTKGSESATVFKPSFKPITNIETTKEWIKTSLVDIFTYDASNYDSKERKQNIAKYFTTDSFNNYWNAEQNLIKEEIKKGILRNTSIISYKPNLLGEGADIDGNKVWKFYLEIFTSSDSKYMSVPISRKRQIIVYIKEIDPSINLKGIGIYKIDIK